MNFENLLTAAFPVFFIGFYFFVSKMLSIMSGWSKLAEQFQYVGIFEGKMRRFQSGRFRKIHMNGCLSIGVCEEGLFLVPSIFFPAFHKPLLIPWSEIVAEPFRKFLAKGHKLTIESFPDIPIVIHGKVFDTLLSQLKSELAAHTQSSEGHAESDSIFGE